MKKNNSNLHLNNKPLSKKFKTNNQKNKSMNYQKSNIPKKQNKKTDELITHFVNNPKPNIPKKMAKNLGFNPKKYESIINSLLVQINQVKNQRKKENELFNMQIQEYLNNNHNLYNKYYDYIEKNLKQNINNTNKKFDEDNNKKSRHEIIEGIMQQYFIPDKSGFKTNPNFKISDIFKGKDKNFIFKNEENKNKIIKKNLNNDNNELSISYNIENIEKNFSEIDNILNSPNLTFQDKIYILTELNKYIDNYSKGIPSIIDKVKTTLNLIYDNDEEKLIRDQIKKNPFIDMASKIAYQMIQENNDYIIENIIDELFIDCVSDLNEINEKKQAQLNKKILINNLDIIKNNINLFRQNEEFVINNQIKKIEEKKTENFDKGNDGYLIDIPNNMKIKEKKYKAQLNKYLIEKCEKKKEDFKNYMLLKGSFYSEFDIFKLYDEIIENEAEDIMNEGINNYINQLHNCVNNMYDKEVNQFNNNI